MASFKLRFASGALGVLVSLSARAITLPEALTKALTSNPDLIAASASLSQAAAATREVKTSYLPALSAEAQYSTTDDVATQLPDANHAVIKVDEDLFQGGRIFSDIERLKQLEHSASAATEEKRLEVAFAVKQHYYSGVSASEQISEWKDAEEEYRHLLKLIEPKFTVGSVPEYDYVKIRLSLSNYVQEELKREAAFGCRRRKPISPRPNAPTALRSNVIARALRP